LRQGRNTRCLDRIKSWIVLAIKGSKPVEGSDDSTKHRREHHNKRERKADEM